MRIDKILTALGRFFIFGGIIVFLFVGYQLWGTGISEQRAQGKLQKDAQKAFAAHSTSSTSSTAVPKPGQSSTTTTTSPLPPIPKDGAIAVMRIPKIKLEKAVVQGTGVADLKKGPGHYTQTPLPGEKGNVGIAGHRTTYGAPFADIGELNTGDDIFITTRQGTFNYKVTVKNIVSPETVSVLDPSKDDRLTLTTCHPKLSAKQRLIVTALLQGPAAIPSPKPAETATPSSPDSAKSTETLGDVSLSGEKADITPALIWGAICIGWIVLMWSMTSFLNRWIIWIFGTPIFLVFLFFFFENFARLLPANA